MDGQRKSKLKTLYLMRFLSLYTDEQHGATIEEMIDWLRSQGISAERKSLYYDLELLRAFGMDIEPVRGKRQEYRLLSREFELPELKLLVDAVGASKFITRRKSHQLLKKLESLASVYQAEELQRSVYVDRRVKTMNESIYYTVDTVHSAINHGKKLSFKYFTYRPDKQRILKKSGAPYLVTPLALTYAQENYYLYAWSAEHQSIRTYRIDRMTDAAESAQDAEHNAQTDAFDPASRANEAFAMFGGTPQKVTLRFSNDLADAAIDRFGTSTMLLPDGTENFSLTAEVMVSPTFFGWVFGFGGRVQITGPNAVREEYAHQLAHALKQQS